MRLLLVATRNRGKFEEIEGFLRGSHPSLRCTSLLDLKGAPEIVEDGSSFLENARKKATILATFSKLPTLGDDSGLEVEALGGRPGVLSRRFAGPDGDDEENNRKLLRKLKGVAPEKRLARFRCAMVLALPNGDSFTALGDVEGVIIDEARGVNGFGYDPIFFLPGLGRTLAELTTEEKNRLSHRAKALEKISAHLSLDEPGGELRP